MDVRSTLSALRNGLIISIAYCIVPSGPAGSAPVVTVPLTDAIGSVGVVTHFNYTDGAYGHLENALKALEYLGVDHLRDHSPMPWIHGAGQLSTYTAVMANGYRFDFVALGGDFDLERTTTQLKLLDKANPGHIDAIEGFNEVDHQPVTFKGAVGAPAAAAAQEALYSGIRADPQLSRIPVYDLTGIDWPKPGSRRADFLNAHIYPQNGSPPNGWIKDIADKAKAHDLPLVITEYGYATFPQSGWLVIGVDPRTQAKGILLGLLEGLSNGIKRTYIYELLDEKPDPNAKERELHFGLFDSRFMPKTSALAVHNLMSIMRTHAESVPAPEHDMTTGLDLDTAGFPDSVHSLAIACPDGKVLLAMWNHALMWDRAKGTPIDTAPIKVDLILPGGFSAYARLDPLESDVPIRLHSEGESLSVNIPDHPVLIELRPDVQ